MPEDVHISSTLVFAILAVLWALLWIGKKAWPGVTALVLFFRSWNGYVDTDGTKVPGVVESIAGLREDVADLKGDVGAAARAAGAAQVTADESLKMLKPNGGSSLRDAVDRVAAAQSAQSDRLAAVADAQVVQSDQLAAVVDDLADLKNTLQQHMTDSFRAPRRLDDPDGVDFRPVTHGGDTPPAQPPT